MNNSITTNTHSTSIQCSINEIFLTHFGAWRQGRRRRAPGLSHAASLIQNKQKWPLDGRAANEIHQPPDKAVNYWNVNRAGRVVVRERVRDDSRADEPASLPPAQKPGTMRGRAVATVRTHDRYSHARFFRRYLMAAWKSTRSGRSLITRG